MGEAVEWTDPAFLRETIEAQFPQLSPAHLIYLGEGCDSTAFEVNGTWVFRFPKRADVEQQLFTEMRVLPVLRELLPISIPAFTFSGRPTTGLPRHFAGYSKLPGRTGLELGPDWRVSDAAAATLGRFLSALHTFPIHEAWDLGVPDQDSETIFEEIQPEALRSFNAVREAAPDAPLDRWAAFLEARVLRAETSVPRSWCVVHSDLAAEHILCDPNAGTITGVIDWSDIAIGDPAVDFAATFHWGGAELYTRVLAHYDAGVDDALAVRARFMAACRGVGDVTFGVDTDRPEYVVAGIRALELSIGA
jgi:aminoglycoside phosphotransferase (APT) family kinase protein